MIDFSDLFEPLEYTIRIGIISGISEERKDQTGLTNAEIMYIQEYGSPFDVPENEQRIPKRPVLQLTKDYVETNMLKEIEDAAVDKYIDGGRTALEKEVGQYCSRIQDYARDIIYEAPENGLLKHNAPSTIRRKGFDHPLFKEGDLARSIVCILEDERGRVVWKKPE